MPLLPNQVEVGCMHCRPPNMLPQVSLMWLHSSVLENQARIQEFDKGGGSLLKVFSRVAKKSIFISLTCSCGQVYVSMLLAYSYKHIGRQYTSLICWKNVTTKKNRKFELWQSRNGLFFGLCCSKNAIFLPAELTAREHVCVTAALGKMWMFQYQNVLSCKIAFFWVMTFFSQMHESCPRLYIDSMIYNK